MINKSGLHPKQFRYNKTFGLKSYREDQYSCQQAINLVGFSLKCTNMKTAQSSKHVWHSSDPFSMHIIQFAIHSLLNPNMLYAYLEQMYTISFLAHDCPYHIQDHFLVSLLLCTLVGIFWFSQGFGQEYGFVIIPLCFFPQQLDLHLGKW